MGDATSSEGGEAPVSALMHGGRPAKEDVHLKREVLLAQLFPSRVSRPKLGRYDLLELVGEGGMGTVFAAYDPRLDRRVAVKLLRQAPGGAEQRRARLLLEAKALARLSHPNIVTIHEVWEEGSEIHLGMEFVQGQSLAEWQRGLQPWRALVEAYRQAGEGLAAAHAAGLVHRDFKPHNAIRRDDGVVKLLDFGLVRLDAVPTEPPGSSTLDEDPEETSASHLTRLGAIMGTPSYMAPEQHAGAPADARSDQFSFCVALWEGLYGELPFAREPSSSGAGVALRRVEPSRDPGVPGWVRRVLERGLALDPAERFPSMRALLRELGRDPAARRRRVLGATAGVVLAMGGGLAIAELRAEPSSSCVALHDPWGPADREAVQRGVLQAGGEAAEQTWELLSPRLDRHARALMELREQSCESHRRGLLPESHYDLQVACLDRREAGFGELVGLLRRGEPSAVSNANKAIGQLPSPLGCTDTEALLAEQPPPEDPGVAAEVARLRQELSRASAEESAGLHVQAEERAAAVLERARGLGYAPLLSEALLRWGSAGMQARHGDAVARLDEALWLSVRTEQRAVAAEAAAKRIFARLELQDRGADVTEAIALARSLVERAGAADWRTRWALANNVAVALERRGEPSEALASYEQALERIPEDEGAFERAATLLNMAPVQVRLGDGEAAERNARAAVDELTALYGSEHPQLRTGQSSLAVVLRSAGRYAEARSTLEAVLRRHSEQDPPPRWMLLEAARIAWRQGDLEAARAWCKRGRDRLAREGGGSRAQEVSLAVIEAQVAAAEGDATALDELDALAAELRRHSKLALGRAEVGLLLGRAAEAEALVAPLAEDSSLSEGTRTSASLLLGRALAAQGRWEQARARLVVLLEVGSGGRLEPLEHAHALQALAIALAGQGHHAAAQAMAEAALEVLAGFDPGSPARSEAEAVRARVLAADPASPGAPAVPGSAR